MRYTLLYEISKPVISALGTGHVLYTIVESVAKGTEAKGCSLLTLALDGESLIRRVSYGLSDNYVRDEATTLEVADDILSGRPVNIYNIGYGRTIRRKEQAMEEGIRSITSLPIYVKKKITGTLRIYFSEPHFFNRGELDFLESIAELAGIILEKEEEFEKAALNISEAKHEVDKLEEEKKSFVSFLSMVAHDLKAPLAAVESYLKVMLRGSTGTLTEIQRQWIDRSILRINGMLELISDLLDISRIETGQILPELETVSWADVLEVSLEVARGLAEPKGIKIITDVNEPKEEIFSSEIRLNQLIDNLVSNAVRYTPEGGSIKITYRADEENVTLCVEDSGTGIKEEIMPRIFDDFFKGEGSPEGTGLGLSICKRVVEIHQGKIWAESPVTPDGKGTRFTFTIPLRAYCKLEQKGTIKEVGEC